MIGGKNPAGSAGRGSPVAEPVGSMKRASPSLLILMFAVGCAGGPEGTDTPPNDAAAGCTTTLRFEPDPAIAGPDTRVRAIAEVYDAPGFVTYAWHVDHQGVPVPTEIEQMDGSHITFPAPTAGIYGVRFEVTALVYCPPQLVDFTVLAEGANVTQVRLHVSPGLDTNVPPIDRLVPVSGGGDFSLGPIILDPGIVVNGQVRDGSVNIPAYLRFMPAAGKEAIVETFTSPTGAFSARVAGTQNHDVLVVPTVPGYAPLLVEDWSSVDSLIEIDSGTPISGVVRDPAGGLLAGAKVQLTIDGVPSTLSTTSATGSFSVRARQVTGMVTVDVTPPAGRGLPRLVASSPDFVLGSAMQINYAASLVPMRDLAGTTVRRQGVAINGAQVTLVGSMAAVGTVTAGTTASASGVVRIAATASATGVLPTTLAPARALVAVTQVAGNDHAVSPIDLTAGVPASIDAPPAQAIATQIRQPDLTPISGAILDAVPVGALALAGVSASVRVTSAASGAIAASFAGGGHYELRFHDPAARGAALIVPDVTAGSIAAAYALRKGLFATGTLQSNQTAVGGASVQILCSLCSGLDRDRPLAEGASGPTGEFKLVVPDPGTM